MVYIPVFDSILREKVPKPALVAAFGTSVHFMNARYASYFFVFEKIFLILAMGTICLDVQKQNASCRASVSSLLVKTG